MRIGSFMEVKHLRAFCNTFDTLHKAIIGIESQFLVFILSGCLRQGLLLNICQWSGRGNFCVALGTGASHQELIMNKRSFIRE